MSAHRERSLGWQGVPARGLSGAPTPRRCRRSPASLGACTFLLHTFGMHGYPTAMAQAAVVPSASMKQRKKDPVQIAIRVPPEWLEDAARLANQLSRPGLEITRTEAFRAAMARGLESLLAETSAEKPRKK